MKEDPVDIFLTGGTGFIGSYVVEELVKHGHRVTILARNVHKVSGFLGRDDVRLVHGRLTDRHVIAGALEGKDACIHLALGWGDTAVDMLEADTLPSLYIFETATKLGIRNMIYTSSIAAFGERRDAYDESTCTRPTSFYGATKAATEAYLFAMSHNYGTQCNVIRPGPTFGNPVVEGASGSGDIRFETIVRRARANEPIYLVQGDGAQFMWAGDLAQIYTSVLTSMHNRQLFTGVSVDFVTWEEIAHLAMDCVGSTSTIILEDRGRDKGQGCQDFSPKEGLGTAIGAGAYVWENGRQDVSLIEKEFGLRFHTIDRLKEYIAYLADHMV
jgi:UDP-glucose 4-epimerase